MHELSIALSLIEVACEEAQRRAVKVAALYVKVGPLSGVLADALASAYELAREGTPLEQTRLEIEETVVLTECAVCGQTRPVVSVQELCCIECGAPATAIRSGRELELTALEIVE